MAGDQRQHLPLEVFLARMEDAEAGQARVAAAEIDDLGRRVGHLEGAESRYTPYALVAAVAFVIGALIVLVRTEPMVSAYALLGPMGVLALIVALPIIGAVYALHVRERTIADNRMIELNRQYFVPYGGFYFPPGKSAAAGRVVEIPDRPPEKRPFSRYDDIRPGRIW